MPLDNRCPQCDEPLTQVGLFRVCPRHGQIQLEKRTEPLRIFLSYGHDGNEELVRRIKADLEKRGHDVWFDKSEIKAGDDWRRSITEGITDSHRVMSFLSKHSTRDPGVCLDEIAIAVGVKGGNLQTVLVESEKEVKPPPSVSHIQWLDMHDWREHCDIDAEQWGGWYQGKLAEIVAVVESDESRRFAGEIETLAGHLKPISSDSRISELLRKGLVGRSWLIEAIEVWRNTPGRDSRLFWVTGAPGVGKSAFAAHFAHYGRDKVIAVQFCQYDKPAHRRASRIVRTLAFQIATRLPDYRKLLLALPEITADELDHKNASELFEYLLTEPLRLAIKGGRERYLIIIDALDEAGEQGHNELVEMLARNAPYLPDWIGIVVTSRPEDNVTGPLKGLDGLKPVVLNTATESNRADICDYLRRELQSHLEHRPNADQLIEQIQEKSEGVFLYVEQFCNDVRRGHILLNRADTFPLGLSGFFRQYFQRQFPDRDYFCKEARPSLRAILAAQEPLPVDMLRCLFRWEDEDLHEFTRALGSLFPIQNEGRTEVVTPYHKSLVDWLGDETQAGPYFVSVPQGHRMLADFCHSHWHAQETTFPTNDSSHHGGAIHSHKLSRYVLAHLPTHLTHAERWDDLETLLMDLEFLERKNESGRVFELLNDFSRAVEALPEARTRRKPLRLIGEAIQRDVHFIARHAHDYPQALFQCLWNSLWWYDCPRAADYYEESEFDLHLPWDEDGPKLYELLEDWLVAKRTRTGGMCWARALRPPALQLGTAQLAVLQGHTESVNAVAWSPSGNVVASVSDDRSVRLWNVHTSVELKTVTRHRRPVRCVAFSPCGMLVASGSEDRDIHVTGVGPRTHQLRLEGHRHWVTAVAFSADGARLFSTALDHTAAAWDVYTGERVYAVSGYTAGATCLALMPGNTAFVVGTGDGRIHLHDVADGTLRATYKVADSSIECVAVLSETSGICCGMRNGQISIVDPRTGGLLKNWTGHSQPVNSLLWSQGTLGLISSSNDNTIQLWESQSDTAAGTLRGHSNYVRSIALSPDGQLLASGSSDRTLRIWNLDATSHHARLLGHDAWIRCVAFAPCGSFVATSADDNAIHLWDGLSGELIDSITEHTDKVRCVSFSEDGWYLASASDDSTIRVWDVDSSEEVTQMLGHEGAVRSVAFSPDGTRIVSTGFDDTIRTWDVDTGDELECFPGQDDIVRRASFAANGESIVVELFDGTCGRLDRSTGETHESPRAEAELRDRYAQDGSRNIECSDLETKLVVGRDRSETAWIPLLNGAEWHPFANVVVGNSGNHFAMYAFEKATQQRQ